MKGKRRGRGGKEGEKGIEKIDIEAMWKGGRRGWDGRGREGWEGMKHKKKGEGKEEGGEEWERIETVDKSRWKGVKEREREREEMKE